MRRTHDTADQDVSLGAGSHLAGHDQVVWHEHPAQGLCVGVLAPLDNSLPQCGDGRSLAQPPAQGRLPVVSLPRL